MNCTIDEPQVAGSTQGPVTAAAAVRAGKPSSPAIWFTSDHHFGHGRIVGYCNRPWWRPAEGDEATVGHLAKVARVHHRGSAAKRLESQGALVTNWHEVPDVAAMEEELVTRWNARVAPRDTVYHLGDFAWWHLSVEEVARVRARLNGRIILIRGNHDQDPDTKKLTDAVQATFPEVHHALSVVVDGRQVVMYHYGPQSWGQSAAAQKKHRGRINDAMLRGKVDPILFLHGHSHCAKGQVVRPQGLLLDPHGNEPWWIPAVDMGVEGWDYAPASLDEILRRVEAAKKPSVFG